MVTGTTEERLEKLERTTRRYRLALAGPGIAVLAGVVIWVAIRCVSPAQAQNPVGAGKVIRARQFILEDENGETRAALYVDKDGPTLGLTDEKGQARAMLYVGKVGPVLGLLDEKGKSIWRAP